jgi:hypothetical protein
MRGLTDADRIDRIRDIQRLNSWLYSAEGYVELGSGFDGIYYVLDERTRRSYWAIARRLRRERDSGRGAVADLKCGYGYDKNDEPRVIRRFIRVPQRAKNCALPEIFNPEVEDCE